MQLQEGLDDHLPASFVDELGFPDVHMPSHNVDLTEMVRFSYHWTFLLSENASVVPFKMQGYEIFSAGERLLSYSKKSSCGVIDDPPGVVVDKHARLKDATQCVVRHVSGRTLCRKVQGGMPA